MNDANEPIPKRVLGNMLVRAALVRMVVSMLSIFPTLLLAALILNPPNAGANAADNAAGLGGIVVFFGVPAIVSWLMTRYYCRPKVACPCCGQSLWDCGTGNFKPGRMKVKDDVRECPHCQTPIV